jgi:hypothetical protein
MAKRVEDASIIETIRKMVAEGESEEKIIRTLKDLGVEPDKAKRLVLLGQADTFALLKNEISKIVTAEIEKNKPALHETIKEEAGKISKEIRSELTKAVIADLRQYEKDITGQSKTFQEQINETVARISELSERVRAKLNELGGAVKQVQLDLDEMKVRGVGTRNRAITLLLIILGIAFCVGDLYLFFVTFSGEITVDSIIITVIMALIGITMLFVSTVI